MAPPRAVQLGVGRCRSMPRAMRVWVLWIALAAAASGCDQLANREQLAAETIKQDPEFRLVLDKHRALVNRIETYARELALKRSTIEQNITQMRKDLATSSSTVKSRIADVRKQMEPERQRLELALSMAGEELRVKRFQRASLGRSLAQLRKAAKGSSSAFPEAERARQQEKLNEMLRDAQRLDQEIAALKTHMQRLKVKVLLIQF